MIWLEFIIQWSPFLEDIYVFKMKITIIAVYDNFCWNGTGKLSSKQILRSWYAMLSVNRMLFALNILFFKWTITSRSENELLFVKYLAPAAYKEQLDQDYQWYYCHSL